MRRTSLIGATALVVAVAIGACGGGGGAYSADTDAISGGSSIYSADCALCHGDFGQGTVGPALDAVVDTFPDCEQQVMWTSLGSDAWQRDVGATYGATDRPISSVMPAFSPDLSARDLAVVSAWTRAEFGGESAADAITSCGVG